MELMHVLWTEQANRKKLETILEDAGLERRKLRPAFVDEKGDFGYAEILLVPERDRLAVQVYASRKDDADHLRATLTGRCGDNGICMQSYGGQAA